MVVLKKRAVATVIVVIMLFSSYIASASRQDGIPVLLYHHVGNDDGGLPRLTITADEFERQVALLHNAGFETISPEQLIAYMKREEVSLPERPILITFDDGYDDNYANALPILQKYGFKAVFFVVGINVDRAQRLSAQQVREMAKSGFAIGGHSMTHSDLTQLSGPELEHEILDNKRQLEGITHQESLFFSYPYGFFNLRSWKKIESAGYQGAFTVLSGVNKAGRDNIFLLRRIPIFSTTDFDALLARLTGTYSAHMLLDYLPEHMDSIINSATDGLL
ncbi:MAG TPA: polysaccharide deacetylase family protein [Methylomusa anaerophila]|uniref:Peptidoglycan-N-acetylmuramic acid deacetylase PdaA n=1 Tax=Methylomusa anaerophila TaxID=1930071 RepID=A0A348AG49_9FIRM|nr:polysaccharide deacetylase family protein [Methylomusa anaerophila]BBB90047.1 peptidoglycan-N-acetylmuramic acid deacetylase PdaA precursor [Methylomusa anaerophila]HML88226.1 polysaccharide deacetylase family protein [Methylomusa anaerophila]